MYIIGLTGGIATGKSTVSSILRELGAVVIDSDEIAHEIMEPGQPAYKDIVDTFGPAILAPDGRIDRTALGKLVFEDPTARFTLNNITHPRVAARFKEKLKELPPDTRVVVWDVPLLLEAGLDRGVNEVWVVWVDEETQIKRLMERNHFTREEALARIRAQMPLEEKMKRADRLIDNRGTVEETKSIVTSYFKEVQRMLDRNHLISFSVSEDSERS